MPAKRVLISIDERILARIDEAVQRSGQTRSGFLAQAALAQIDGETDRRVEARPTGQTDRAPADA